VIVDYYYTVNGSASGGQTWEVRGTITYESMPPNIMTVVDEAMRGTFRVLSNDKYLSPYEVNRILLELAE
jgi:hypothetical protein